MKSRKLIPVIICLMLVITTLTVSCSETATQQTAEEFYKDNVLTINCGFSPGGSTDLWARLATSYIAAIMGENATCGVKTVSGGAGMVSLNQLYNDAKPDGLTIGTLAISEIWLKWAAGAEGVAYDPKEFNYLGSLFAGVPALCVAADGPYKTIEDLQAASASGKELILSGGSARGSDISLFAAVAIETLGLDTAKMVYGFRGSSEEVLKLQQGEVDCVPITTGTALRYEGEGTVKILAVIRPVQDEFFPDLPVLGDFAEISEQHQWLLRFVPIRFGYFAPPDTPDDRVEYLRDAFETVFNDESFQSAIVKVSGAYQGCSSGVQDQQDAIDFAQGKDEFNRLFSELLEKYSK